MHTLYWTVKPPLNLRKFPKDKKKKKTLIASLLAKCTTVEPPNRGHFGTAAFVLSSEVV